MKSFPDPNGSLSHSMTHPNLQYLSDVEGQCRIQSIQGLKIRFIKFIPVLLISILTIIPAILLLNFKRVRKYLLYSACDFTEAEYLFIQAEDENYDLVAITKQDSESTFIFKQLKYVLKGSNYFPMVIDYKKQISKINLESIIKVGLNSLQIQNRQKKYGKNIHLIQIQNYFSYMASVIFQPLYILQYIVVLSLTAQGLPLFGIILVIASLITTSGNYIALYISKRKIRDMAQKQSMVNIIRNSSEVSILSGNLVPGDIIEFSGQSQIPCDCIILSGQMFVDESSLTGENIPIKKINYHGDIQSQQIWIYDGTKVLQAKQTKAMVIYTNFASKKGRLLRKILNRVPNQPDFFIKMFIFLLESFVIGMTLYGATLPIRLSVNIDKGIVALRALDYLISSVPPAFPVYFTIAYSWSLYRLKKKGIFSTMPQKTVQSNRLKTVCFDKTGTLTSNNLNYKAFYYLKNDKIQQMDLNKDSLQKDFMKLIFGTCHSVRKINGEYRGDQIDLRLWEISNFSFGDSNQYVDQKQQQYNVLILNQFQSKFQSMSVLIKQLKTGRHYIFVKGAPQKIHNSSIKKYSNFSNFISQLSFKGLRTIAFGYKIIQQNEVTSYLSKNREQFLKNIQINGIACFQNPLKQQTINTIKQLHGADLTTKIITGDNIYIAVQIAYQSGILPINRPILIVEGKKFVNKNNQILFQVLKVTKNQNQTIKIQEQYSLQKIISSNLPIATDDDFLQTYKNSINQRIVVFARILPNKKAKIVQCIKQEFQNSYHAQACIKKIFGEGRNKVAMVGDGANDLMAIKQADVGVGLNGTDAVYSSAFSINNLDDFIYIVRQGKCTTMNIIQCLKFTIIANYINLVVEILLATQATFISQMQGLYINFLIIILVPIIMSLSPPFKTLTPNRVKDNFLNWKNQISVWGTIIILSAGLVGSYFFIIKSSTYIPNPTPIWSIGVQSQNGYNFNCQLVTLVFLGQGLTLSTLGWIISQSSPFKKYIFRNIILTIVLILNFIAFTAYFFIIPGSQIGFLNLLKIELEVSGVQYAIIVGSIILSFIFNFILHKKSNKTTQKINSRMQQTLVTLNTEI